MSWFILKKPKCLSYNFNNQSFSIIVIGDSEGHVRFVDQHLHVLMWYKHLKLGPINSLSFSANTKDYQMFDAFFYLISKQFIIKI